MITFHPDFVPIPKLDGYFWNLKEKHLYSIKSGSLKKIKKQPPNRWVYWFHGPFYCCSVNNKKKYLFQILLEQKFKEEVNYELPY